MASPKPQNEPERLAALRALSALETKWKSVVDAAIDGIIVADTVGTITHVNPAAERMFGWTTAEAAGQPLTLVIPERFHAAHQAGIKRYLSTGEPRVIGKTIELSGRRRDGSEFPLELSLASCRADGGTIFAGIIRDITDRKFAESVLRASEEKFHAVADTSPNGIMIYAGNKILYVNRYVCEVSGYTEEEIKSSPVGRFAHPDDQRRITERAAAIMRGTYQGGDFEYRLVTKSGEVRWVESRSTAVEFEGQRAILSVAVDITQRKRVEEALRNSEAKFRALADTSPTSILIYSGQQVLYVNRRFCETIGYTEEQLKSAALSSFAHPEDQMRAVERIAAMMEGQSAGGPFEYRTIAKSGEVRWMESRATRLEFERRPAVLSVSIDITERKRWESALRQSERKSHALMEQAADAIFISDANAKYTDVNSAACSMLGYSREELLHMNARDMLTEEEAAGIQERWARLRQGETIVRERLLRHKNGSWIPVETSTKLIDDDRLQSIARDISERKRKEVEREKLIAELQEALAKVKTLSGLLPICASCKKIRDDKGYWNNIENYVRDHSQAEFTHGICPECTRRLYPETFSS